MKLQSDDIGELAKALSQAQGTLKNVSKDSKGVFGKYATLDAVLDEMRQPLSENGLSLVQGPAPLDGQLWMVSTLLHSSGQWIRSFWPLNPIKPDPAGYGAAATYARRYAGAAIVGIAQTHDVDSPSKEAPARSKETSKESKTLPSKAVLGKERGAKAHAHILKETSFTKEAQVAWAYECLERDNFEDFSELTEAEMKRVLPYIIKEAELTKADMQELPQDDALPGDTDGEAMVRKLSTKNDILQLLKKGNLLEFKWVDFFQGVVNRDDFTRLDQLSQAELNDIKSTAFGIVQGREGKQWADYMSTADVETGESLS